MEKPIVVEDDEIIVDCYRFKLQINEAGDVRIYAFNARDKGDVEVLIKPNKLELTWEKGDQKPREILKERIRQVVFNRVFSH